MKIVPAQLQSFAESVLMAAGSDPEDARVVARILLWADSVGLFFHGVERLPILCRRLEKALIRSPFAPVWSEPGGAVAQLDAADGFGHLAAELAATRAVELARSHGIGAVTVSNSNYFGAAGYPAWLIARSQMVGLAFSNSFPKVAAYGGRGAVLGTNPMAFAAPVADEDPILLDMATASVAGSEIRGRAATGTPLDPGTAVDPEGNPLLDASQFKDKGVLLPFGGAKGFGLMILVETLAGALTGGAIGSEVKSMYQDFANPGRSGHFFLSIAPERLLPDGSFPARMRTLRAMVEASGPDVRMPGQTRWRQLEATREGGLEPDNLPIAKLRELSEQYAIASDFLSPG